MHGLVGYHQLSYHFKGVTVGEGAIVAASFQLNRGPGTLPHYCPDEGVPASQTEEKKILYSLD